MNIQVMEDNDGKTHFDELIDLALVVISDSAWETRFNLLKNAKNNMIDNFSSIKWLFHEIEDLKGKRSHEGSQQNSYDQGHNEEKRNWDGSQWNNNVQGHNADQQEKITKIEQKVQRLESTHQNLANQVVSR